MNEKQSHNFDVDYLTGVVKKEKDKKEPGVKTSIYISETFVFLIDLLVKEDKYPDRSAFFYEAFYEMYPKYKELMSLKLLLKEEKDATS